jgi:hypothetical protein
MARGTTARFKVRLSSHLLRIRPRNAVSNIATAFLFSLVLGIGLLVRLEGDRGFYHFFDRRWIKSVSPGPLALKVAVRLMILIGLPGFVVAMLIS